MRIEKIDFTRLRGRDLFTDYIDHPDRVREFLPHHPGEAESWHEMIRLQHARDLDRSGLVAALKGYNRRIGASAEVMRNIALLADPGALAVITGQQPGALTGPLYTIYKALTAVRLSRTLTLQSGLPCIPVFWNASEDHDFAEVNHYYLIDREGVLRRIEYEPREEIEGLSSFSIPLEESARGLIDELVTATPETDFKEGFAGLVSDALESSATFGEWFSRILVELFREWGVVMADPGDRALRLLMKPLFRRELAEPLASAVEMKRGGERLEASGYRSPIASIEGATNLFYYEEGKRRRLHFADGVYRVAESGREYEVAELLDILEDEPQRFSANVALRPIVQDSIFPTAAYIGGPAEIEYFGQLGGMYRHFGLTLPIIYPRMSVTIVETKVGKVLDKYGIGLDELRGGADAVTKSYARETLPESVSDAFARARATIDEAFGEVEREASKVDANLTRPAAQIRSKMSHQVSLFEEKVVRAHKRANEILVQQVGKAGTHLFPEGRPQERVLNVFPYLFRYGPSFLSQLADAIEVSEYAHHVIYLE